MYTVLVCDDDRAILESVRIYLSAEGYEVLTAPAEKPKATVSASPLQETLRCSWEARWFCPLTAICSKQP